MSTIQVWKSANGYISEKARKACRNCASARRDVELGITAWRCRAGGLRTTALAVCDRHEAGFPEIGGAK